MLRLSKTRVMAWLQCPKRLWLELNAPARAEYDAGRTARFATGHRVGELARELLAPGGVLIEAPSSAEAARETAALLHAGEPALYEATFVHDDVTVKADILRHTAAGHTLIEVKSSASVKEYHLPDAAIQWHVLAQCGVELTAAAIGHLDTTFVYPGDGDYDGLVVASPVTDEVTALVPEVADWIAQAKGVAADGEPDITTGEQCNSPFECPFLGHCLAQESHPRYPVSILPHGGRLIDELAEDGYDDLTAVPRARLAKPKHLRVWEASRTGKPVLDPAATAAVRALPYPRYYLDFETIAFAVPIWPGTRPYEALPFQWSCHVEQADGSIAQEGFLDLSGEPPMRAFAESLLAALGEDGPILVYSAYERTQVLGLAERFPDLAASLEALVPRLVDLLPIVRAHYYHPDMLGRWSIKAVLPTVAPDLDYSDLAVADGDAAQTAYLEALEAGTGSPEAQRIAAALEAYCARDTEAMVRLVRFLAAGDDAR